jgi:DNA alkylation repair enzyme
MTATDIMLQLQNLGQESYKKILLKHGIVEPLYGVKIEELKKMAKKEKNGYPLSLELWDTGIYDARYLAGLLTEPTKMRPADLQHWAETANAPVLRESTVAWVASESLHGWHMGLEWIGSGNADLSSSGWATLGDLVAITDDAALDIPAVGALLDRAAATIHQSENREKLTQNGFIIAVGTYIKPLHEAALAAAAKVGKVTADMGDTACKIPDAAEYIGKAIAKNTVGKKRKSARCL